MYCCPEQQARDYPLIHYLSADTLLSSARADLQLLNESHDIRDQIAAIDRQLGIAPNTATTASSADLAASANEALE